MDRLLQRKISQHIREAEKPNISPRYYRSIQLIIHKVDKQISSELRDGDLRYRYTPVRSNGELVSVDAYPQRSGFVFNLLGILEIIDLESSRVVEDVYCCLESFEQIGIIFWVDKNGRIANDERCDSLTLVYNQLCSDNRLKAYTPEKNNSSESRQYGESGKLFSEQAEHIRQLSETNDIKHYSAVIKTGEAIIALNDQSFPYMSGTYVNMASAEFALFQINGMNAPNNVHLQAAQRYIENAVKKDSSNQNALMLKLLINLFALNFVDAINALMSISVDGFCRPILENPSLLETYMHYLGSQHNISIYQSDLDNCFKLIRMKSQGKTQVYNLVLYDCAQIYYYVFGDVANAYSFIDEGLKEQPGISSFINIYSLMCQICMHPALQKHADALKYAEIAYKYASKSENDATKAACFSNYGVALAYNGKIQDGINLCKEAVTLYPDDTTFYNVARCLVLAKEYYEAITWGKKALFLHDDETNHLLIADAYKKLGLSEKALEHYIKAFQLTKEPLYHIYNTTNGDRIGSFIAPNTLNEVMVQSLSSIISIYIKEDKTEEASAYLQIAKEMSPDRKEWEFLEDTMDIISTTDETLKRIKKDFEAKTKKYEDETRMSRELVLKLIKLQDDSQDLDFENYTDWKIFDDSIGKIISRLEDEAKRNKELMININNRIRKRFPGLSEKAFHFLSTAEVLYEMNKNQEIDFACIVVEYCKVLETQLRVIMGGRIPDDMKMLGQIIRLISDNRISPYCRYLKQLNTVNNLRKQSAHVGALTESEVEIIRSIYFNERLLDVLI